MVNIPIEREIILRRLTGVQGEIAELEKIRQEPLGKFSSGVGFKLAQFHLHRALEGVFNIASHILSRFPGAAPTSYKDMALKLGEYGIVEKDYAQMKLAPMAGYRNRLVHFYAEITLEEMYKILETHLKDVENFLRCVKNVLDNPQNYNLTSI